MNLHDRLKHDLTAALRDRDLETARLLRVLVAAVDNAGAVEAGPKEGTVGHADVPRRHVPEAEILEILAAEAGELRGAITDYEAHGRPHAALPLRARLAAVERYLAPKPAD